MYEVIVTNTARKQILSLPQRISSRISAAIDGLKANPRPKGSKKLEGVDGYRIRIGDYRIIYTIEEIVKIVTIVKVGHRRDIYR